MSAELLERSFGIKPDGSIQDGPHIRYVEKGFMYTIVAVTHMEQEALIELYEMSEHMAKFGDKKVSTFVPSKDRLYVVSHKDDHFILLKNIFIRPASAKRNMGRDLAKFHERGKLIPIQVSNMNRLGQWQSLWEKRMEQMEKVWAGMVREKPQGMFEKMFIENFSYFLGLWENAMQYVKDTELDQEPAYSDGGTIAHERFSDRTWNPPYRIKNPIDWVFDHRSRDMAEWIRNCYHRSPASVNSEIAAFAQGYQSVSPISAYTWRMIYARLLFPLHFIECAEDYFSAQSQWAQKQLEEKMGKFIRDTREYEAFLRNFFHMAGISRNYFPSVEWV
ncbi:MAG TPA: spore coat protein YutH [Bacillaceae bacterium]